MSDMHKIAFFFPSHKVGGVEVLYCNLATRLHKRGFEIEIIDYDDGFISTSLRKSNIPFLFTEYDPDKKVECKSEIVVLSLLFLANAKKYFSNSVRLLFWDDHPYNILLALRGVRLINFIRLKGYSLFAKLSQNDKYRQLRSYLQLAAEKSGVVFMCQNNYYVNSLFFNLPLNPSYLPIPVREKEMKYAKTVGKVIQCSYLGRLDDDKVGIVVDLANEVINFNKSATSKIVLHIIGDGNRKADVEAVMQNDPQSIKMLGTVKGPELDAFFINDVHLAFAIGTSALESAALGIPTIVLRTPNNRVLRRKYIWLFELSGFDLSLSDLGAKHMKVQPKSFVEMISQFSTSRESLSKQCFTYVEKNHSIKAVEENLLKYLELSTLTNKDIEQLNR